MGLYLPSAMVAGLRAILAMVRRSGSPMVVVTAQRYQQELEKHAASEAPPGDQRQLGLWEMRPDGTSTRWRGRLQLHDAVTCAEFSSPALPLRTCLLRQGATWPGGNRCADGTVRKKKAGIHPYCASGKCEQGRLYMASAPVGWVCPIYSEFRKDTPQQLVARERWQQTHPAQSPTIDAPPPAEETPDDDADEITAITEGKTGCSDV